MRFSVRSAVGLAVGALALVAVPTFGLAGVAAANGESGNGDGGRGPRPALTDEQKECLAGQGVTLPDVGAGRPAEGSDPSTRTKPTDEQRAAMKAAAEACGLPTPPAHRDRPQLTDEQKECLAGQGVTLPDVGAGRPAEGFDPSTRTKPTDEQRAAMKAAAEACGLPAPGAPPAGESGVQGTSTGSVRLTA